MGPVLLLVTYLGSLPRERVLLRAQVEEWQNLCGSYVTNRHGRLRHGCERRTLVAAARG